MKKFPIILLCLFFVLPVFCAGCKQRDFFSCRITDGEEIVLEKTYSLSFYDYLTIRKSGSLKNFFLQQNKSPLNFLRSLSCDLAEDIERCKERDVAKTEPDCQYLGEGEFSFTEGKAGRSVPVEEIALRVIESGGSFDGALPYRPLPPLLTTEDLKRHTEKTVSFSTDYSSSSPERKHNIALAVRKLDNLTVEGGSELSFNAAVGKRTVENGYRESIVISFGQFARGVGGGVCQVSTTLYNAWIKAGLDAAGNNHSLIVSYVPVGLDAMVSEKSDLLLKNNSLFPVYIDADCDGEKVTFTLYGTPPKEEIRLSGEKVATYPCDEYEISYGEEEKVLSEPKDGYLYQSYREFYRDGKLVRKEKLRASSYKKVKGKKILPKKRNDEYFPPDGKE